MKKLTSVLSTRPQQTLYTDFSSLKPQTSTSKSAAKIFLSLRQILNKRTHLYERDIQEIYEIQPSFFVTFLNAYDGGELWEIARNSPLCTCIGERQIMAFFTKLIIKMTQQKNLVASNQEFDRFSELKTSIEWIRERIVELEEVIRKTVMSKGIQKKEAERMRLQQELNLHQDTVNRAIEETTQFYHDQLHHKQIKQSLSMKKTMKKKIQDESYRYCGSKRLREAKQISLLAKLSPFKNEKKRPYQCRQLQSMLSQTIDADQLRINREIQSFKANERHKMEEKQRRQNECYLSNLHQENKSEFRKLECERETLEKSERIKMQKLIKSNNKQTRLRIESLRKSLQAYSQRDESTQIRKIMRQHHNTIQHLTNIEDIQQMRVDPLISGGSVHPYRLSLDLKSEERQKREAMRKSEEYLKNRILRRIKKQEVDDELENEGLRKRKKSLVDLYDRNLDVRM